MLQTQEKQKTRDIIGTKIDRAVAKTTRDFRMLKRDRCERKSFRRYDDKTEFKCTFRRWDRTSFSRDDVKR